MPRTQLQCPPGNIWSPWTRLEESCVWSKGNANFTTTISIEPLGDGAVLVGEVKYYAPGGVQRVDTFFDTITITRDGRSSDIVEVRCKNTNFLGTAVNIDY